MEPPAVKTQRLGDAGFGARRPVKAEGCDSTSMRVDARTREHGAPHALQLERAGALGAQARAHSGIESWSDQLLGGAILLHQPCHTLGPRIGFVESLLSDPGASATAESGVHSEIFGRRRLFVESADHPEPQQ